MQEKLEKYFFFTIYFFDFLFSGYLGHAFGYQYQLLQKMLHALGRSYGWHRFGFCVLNFLSFISDFLSREKLIPNWAICETWILEQQNWPKNQFFKVVQNTKGTIHLRRRQIFTIFDPYPPSICIPGKCLWRGFLILMYCDLLTISTWGHPSPLRDADALN